MEVRGLVIWGRSAAMSLVKLGNIYILWQRRGYAQTRRPPLFNSGISQSQKAIAIDFYREFSIIFPLDSSRVVMSLFVVILHSGSGTEGMCYPIQTPSFVDSPNQLCTIISTLFISSPLDSPRKSH
jgi:hypothetical protein